MYIVYCSRGALLLLFNLEDQLTSLFKKRGSHKYLAMPSIFLKLKKWLQTMSTSAFFAILKYMLCYEKPNALLSAGASPNTGPALEIMIVE